MKGLTLHQPYASLVAFERKCYETRSWPTQYRGLVAIHAAKFSPDDAIDRCSEAPFKTALAENGIFGPADLPRGAVLAVAELVACVPAELIPHRLLAKEEAAFGDYSTGRHVWILDVIHKFPEPIPCSGAQGLWTIPGSVYRRMKRTFYAEQRAKAEAAGVRG